MPTVNDKNMDSLVGPLVAQYLSMGYQSQENLPNGCPGPTAQEKDTAWVAFWNFQQIYEAFSNNF